MLIQGSGQEGLCSAGMFSLPEPIDRICDKEIAALHWYVPLNIHFGE